MCVRLLGCFKCVVFLGGLFVFCFFVLLMLMISRLMKILFHYFYLFCLFFKFRMNG